MLTETRKERLAELATKLETNFNDITLLNQALIHSSYAYENRTHQIQSNERLEFLGDAVLELVISNHIYKSFPQLPEGEMTKMRAAVVNENVLSRIAKKANLGDFMLLGKGEEISGGRKRPALLADAFEAVIGAIFLDSGLSNTTAYLMKFLAPEVEKVARNEHSKDYKSTLQEIVQKTASQGPVYKVLKEKGPDHAKIFIACVSVKDRILGYGRGRSKKEAEQMAAKRAMRKLQKTSQLNEGN